MNDVQSQPAAVDPLGQAPEWVRRLAERVRELTAERDRLESSQKALAEACLRVESVGNEWAVKCLLCGSKAFSAVKDDLEPKHTARCAAAITPTETMTEMRLRAEMGLLRADLETAREHMQKLKTSILQKH